MARITGVGGIFFKARDPKALSAWYRDVLGLAIEDWSGAMLPYDAPGHPPCVVWTPFAEDTTYFEPSAKPFMINFAVDDLDGMLAAIAAKGVPVHARKDDESFGRFAWIMDPDGNKVELWQPIEPPSH